MPPRRVSAKWGASGAMIQPGRLDPAQVRTVHALKQFRLSPLTFVATELAIPLFPGTGTLQSAVQGYF